MIWYLYFSTATFLLLAIAWRHENWPNTFIKAVLIILTVCGGFFVAFQNGWIVKH